MGIMLGGEGLHPSSKGGASKVFRQNQHRDPRPISRHQSPDCWILDLAGPIHGRGDRLDQARAVRWRNRDRNPTDTGDRRFWRRLFRRSVNGKIGYASRSRIERHSWKNRRIAALLFVIHLTTVNEAEDADHHRPPKQAAANGAPPPPPALNV